MLRETKSCLRRRLYCKWIRSRPHFFINTNIAWSIVLHWHTGMSMRLTQPGLCPIPAASQANERCNLDPSDWSHSAMITAPLWLLAIICLQLTRWSGDRWYWTAKRTVPHYDSRQPSGLRPSTMSAPWRDGDSAISVLTSVSQRIGMPTRSPVFGMFGSLQQTSNIRTFKYWCTYIYCVSVYCFNCGSMWSFKVEMTLAGIVDGSMTGVNEHLSYLLIL